METVIYNKEGKEAGKLALPEAVFALPYNGDLLHQVMVSMQSNMRAGTAHTKDRSEVRGGGRKPWKQKGTGQARHGSRRSPIWVKGGVAHGPRADKDYSKKINKKMRIKALFVALSQKLRDGKILFVESIDIAEPKTKQAALRLQALSHVAGFDRLADAKKVVAHIVTPAPTDAEKKSFNNINFVSFDALAHLNVLDVVNREYLVIVNPNESITALAGKLA
jgi:large subunit ribosomal protein L4